MTGQLFFPPFTTLSYLSFCKYCFSVWFIDYYLLILHWKLYITRGPWSRYLYIIWHSHKSVKSLQIVAVGSAMTDVCNWKYIFLFNFKSFLFMNVPSDNSTARNDWFHNWSFAKCSEFFLLKADKSEFLMYFLCILSVFGIEVSFKYTSVMFGLFCMMVHQWWWSQICWFSFINCLIINFKLRGNYFFNQTGHCNVSKLYVGHTEYRWGAD